MVFRRVDKNLRALESKDEGTYVSDDFLAELYLHKSGLSRHEHKYVFEKAGGDWNPTRIRESILQHYELAHELDEARILHSRNSRGRPHGVKFVKHNPGNGVVGTDSVPELVEELDLHDQLDTSHDVFDSANPVYMTTTEDNHTLPEEEPQTVLWTSNPLEDDSGLEEGEDDQDYDQYEDQEYYEDEDDRDESYDEEENDSPDPTDEEDLASAVGDIFEQGYLKTMEEQNIDLEDGVSEAQREVFLTTWKGARSFKGKGSSRGRTPKRETRKGKFDAKPTDESRKRRR